jgi:hypothetical protein
MEGSTYRARDVLLQLLELSVNLRQPRLVPPDGLGAESLQLEILSLNLHPRAPHHDPGDCVLQFVASHGQIMATTLRNVCFLFAQAECPFETAV